MDLTPLRDQWYFYKCHAFGSLVEGGIAARKAAGLYLRELEKTRVLKSFKIGKEVVFINVALYNLFGGNASAVEK